MNKNFIFVVVSIVVIGGIGLLVKGSNSKTGVNQNPATSQTSSKEGKSVEGYNGRVLAGSASPYIEFNKSDYDKALSSGKVVFLDFYANWCPICRDEAPNLKSGFDNLTTDKVVGFRVNYNDSETDEDEKKLAQKFGITYQHTKVILKEGKEVSKSLESWDKETFLKTISQAL